MNKKRTSFLSIGIPSMCVIFSVLCLVILALLTLGTSRQDLQTSRLSLDQTTAYYTACSTATQQYSQISDFITSALTDSSEKKDYLSRMSSIQEEFPDIYNWYIGGHSLGGAMAASYAANYQDKLKGLVLLAAYPTKELDIPVLSNYGSEDGFLNREKYSDSIKNANNLSEIVIDGGNHAQFGNYGEQLGDNSAKISSEKQWNETIKEILNFMK